MKLFYRKIPGYSSGSLSREAWRKLCRNKLAFAAMLYIALSSMTAILGYLITPDSTPMANRQFVELGAKKPFFRVKMLMMEKQETISRNGIFHKMLFGSRDIYQYIPIQDYHYSSGILTISSYTGEEGNPGQVATYAFDEGKWQGHIVEKTFILGTDQFGRDLLSRLLIGSRVSLAVGFIAVAISLIIGIAVGAAGGFFRGRTDKVVVWLINVVWAVPTLLLVIAITFALGKGFWQVFIAVGFTMWVEVARVTRGQILSVREKEYVEAARALGFSNLRIILRHVLPNISGPIIVVSAANLASAILIEAGLSFLGIGIQPPMPSWGTMLRENYAYLLLDEAHLAILPGIAIMMIVLSFMILGNGLRDALDVKSQQAFQS